MKHLKEENDASLVYVYLHGIRLPIRITKVIRRDGDREIEIAQVALCHAEGGLRNKTWTEYKSLDGRMEVISVRRNDL